LLVGAFEPTSFSRSLFSMSTLPSSLCLFHSQAFVKLLGLTTSPVQDVTPGEPMHPLHLSVRVWLGQTLQTAAGQNTTSRSSPSHQLHKRATTQTPTEEIAAAPYTPYTPPLSNVTVQQVRSDGQAAGCSSWICTSSPGLDPPHLHLIITTLIPPLHPAPFRPQKRAYWRNRTWTDTDVARLLFYSAMTGWVARGAGQTVCAFEIVLFEIDSKLREEEW